MSAQCAPRTPFQQAVPLQRAASLVQSQRVLPQGAAPGHRPGTACSSACRRTWCCIATGCHASSAGGAAGRNWIDSHYPQTLHKTACFRSTQTPEMYWVSLSCLLSCLFLGSSHIFSHLLGKGRQEPKFLLQ